MEKMNPNCSCDVPCNECNEDAYNYDEFIGLGCTECGEIIKQNTNNGDGLCKSCAYDAISDYLP